VFTSWLTMPRAVSCHLPPRLASQYRKFAVRVSGCQLGVRGLFCSQRTSEAGAIHARSVCSRGPIPVGRRNDGGVAADREPKSSEAPGDEVQLAGVSRVDGNVGIPQQHLVRHHCPSLSED